MTNKFDSNIFNFQKKNEKGKAEINTINAIGLNEHFLLFQFKSDLFA